MELSVRSKKLKGRLHANKKVGKVAKALGRILNESPVITKSIYFWVKFGNKLF